MQRQRTFASLVFRFLTGASADFRTKCWEIEKNTVNLSQETKKHKLMTLNEKFVITINREMGSGGRTTGRLLAEKLGITFYDDVVIKAFKERHGLTIEEIEAMKGKKKNWWSDFKRIIGIGPGMTNSTYLEVRPGHEPELLTGENVFREEMGILEGITYDQSCVLAGRTAFFAMRHHPNHLSILIKAPMQQRVARVARKQNISEDEARKKIDEVDQMRENYVRKFCNSDRYDTRNYDLVLSSEGKTEQELVQSILQFLGNYYPPVM